MSYIIPKNYWHDMNAKLAATAGLNIIEYTNQIPPIAGDIIGQQYESICKYIEYHGQELEDLVLNTLLDRKNKRELDSLINEE